MHYQWLQTQFVLFIQPLMPIFLQDSCYIFLLMLPLMITLQQNVFFSDFSIEQRSGFIRKMNKTLIHFSATNITYEN